MASNLVGYIKDGNAQHYQWDHQRLVVSIEMKYLVLVVLFTCTVAHEDITLGMSEANPVSSCNKIYQSNLTSRGTIG